MILVSAFALYGSDAAADMLPEGAKGVKLSIQVDADPPSGKAIVLGGTFKGAMVLTAGEVAPVAWHPMAGDLQLHLVDQAIADKIGPLREAMDRDRISALLGSTPACGGSFSGVRTLPESEPADEIRWVYKLGATADGCESSLEKMIFLDASGTSVKGPGGEAAVVLELASKDPEGAPKAAAKPAAEDGSAAKSGEPAPESTPRTSGSGCGCVSVRGEGAPAVGLFVLALLVGRRRPS